MHTPGFCAIIVAGGKSSRLGNTPKAGLSNGTHTLLDRALLAVSQADACVVVGPETLPVPNDVLLTREDPPYSGPAAAIHAGAEKLAQHYSGIGRPAPTWCIILGVDTPNIAPAVSLLAEHAGPPLGTKPVSGASVTASTSLWLGYTAMRRYGRCFRRGALMPPCARSSNSCTPKR